MRIATEVNTHVIEVKNNLGAALTALQGLNVYDLETIKQWSKYIPAIHITGDVQIPEEGGIRWSKGRRNPPLLDEVVRSYLMTVPGNKVVMLALPTFDLADGCNNIIRHAEENRMELAWAAHVTMPGDSCPSAFFITGTTLGHMLNNIPQGLEFAGINWSFFVHDWMVQNMFAHRYFDASAMNVIPMAPEGQTAETPSPTPADLSKARKNNWSGF